MVCVQPVRLRVISDAEPFCGVFSRTYPTKVAPLPRKAAARSCSAGSFSPMNTVSGLSLRARGTKLYLTCRVKSRTLCFERVSLITVHENVALDLRCSRRISVVSFAECAVSRKSIPTVNRAFSARRESRNTIYEESFRKQLNGPLRQRKNEHIIQAWIILLREL